MQRAREIVDAPGVTTRWATGKDRKGRRYSVLVAEREGKVVAFFTGAIAEELGR